MTNKLSIDQVNYLNILMMMVAAIAACTKPFETFLFAYAFLGPLHYLTEISWLHDRQYYSRTRHDYLLLVAAGVLITLDYFRMLPGVPGNAAAVITGTAFLSALILVRVENSLARIAWILLAAAGCAWLARVTVLGSMFGILLPTLIHVFVFTGLFILTGALKGRSLSGLLSLLAFAAISLGVYFHAPSPATYHVSEYVRNSYGYLKQDGNWENGFAGLNYQIASALDLHDFSDPAASFSRFVNEVNDFIYQSPLALSIMSFIAFAYLYHYLNWFSKTSVIGWHDVPRFRMMVIVILWIATLMLYMYDYTIGLKVLFCLSITHVLLEFPLNHLTFIDIGKEIGAIVRARGERSEPSN